MLAPALILPVYIWFLDITRVSNGAATWNSVRLMRRCTAGTPRFWAQLGEAGIAEEFPAAGERSGGSGRPRYTTFANSFETCHSPHTPQGVHSSSVDVAAARQRAASMIANRGRWAQIGPRFALRLLPCLLTLLLTGTAGGMGLWRTRQPPSLPAWAARLKQLRARGMRMA